MSVFKVHKNKSYTVMSNYHLKEKDMSLKAIGLLSIMLSLPEDWDYSISGLCAIRKENETAIKSALNELKSFGYLRVDKIMPSDSSSGRIEYEYNIFECPQRQAVEKQGVEILRVENQGQLNTKEETTKTKKESKKESVDKERNFTDDELYYWFDTTYEIYPRKAVRVKSRQAYEHKIRGLTRDEAKDKANAIFLAVKKQVALWNKENDYEGRKLEHIPYFSSWLNANIEDSPHFKRRK